MDVRVECYAGYQVDETPRRLLLDARRVEVVEVLERWRGPAARGFRIRGDDGVVYDLVQTESGAWSVEVRPSR